MSSTMGLTYTPRDAIYLIPLLLVIGLIRTLLIAFKTPLNKVPGPFLAKFTNLPLKLSVIQGRRIHYIHSLHEKYGPYVRISPNEVAVNDPAGCKQIHGVSGNFGKSPWYGKFTTGPRPTLFTMEDKRSHAGRRKILFRGFSKTNIRAEWESHVRDRIELVVKRIREDAAKHGGNVDILKWFFLMASDVSSHLAYAESFHTIEAGEVNEYIRVLTQATKGSGIGAELPLFRAIAQKLPFKTTHELFNTQDILEEKARFMCRRMKAIGGGKNFFANAQAEAEKEEGRFDDRDIELESVAFFVAGTDTTAVSLTYMIWAVLSRPQLRTQVEAEIATLPENYTDADIEALPLVSAVIEENLRLYGAAPGMLPRIVPDGGADMGGYYIPQGITVTTHAYSLHRDPVLYPNPYEFDPDRWIPDPSGKDDARIAAAKASMSPFGSGPRTCLGMHLAYMELRLGFVEFLRKCPSSWLADSTTPASMEMENFFLIAPKAHKCEIVIK